MSAPSEENLVPQGRPADRPVRGHPPSRRPDLRNRRLRRPAHLETSLPEEALIAAVRDAHFIGIRSRTQLSAEVFEAAKRLVAVGCYCIGTNQVDLEAAESRGIPVFNAPYSNTRSVAELVIGEAILLLRRIPEKNAASHRGGWLKSAEGSYEARDKTIGIVGYGRIGTQVGVLAESLGLHVLYYDIEAKLALGNAKPVDELDDLLKRSDVVTIHVPETAGTRDLIDARRVALLKPGSVFLNAQHGAVMTSKHWRRLCAQAAFRGSHRRLPGRAEVQPRRVPVAAARPRQRDPHAARRRLDGRGAGEHRRRGHHQAAEVLQQRIDAHLGEPARGRAAAAPGSHRLLHIHRNVPGMLAQVNAIFSGDQVNIDAQYLQTSPRVGYVVLDVRTDEATALQARDRLAAIDGTIRTRILY